MNSFPSPLNPRFHVRLSSLTTPHRLKSAALRHLAFAVVSAVFFARPKYVSLFFLFTLSSCFLQ